uniref:Uncharacterized protein n=1 Tax=Wuchereria bancrofti TaxID=6293 RepID=A0AAF5Q6G1_WUCBA
MVEDDKGILKLIEDGWETLISLKLHIEDIQATMQCLQQSVERTSRNNSETDRISSQQEQGSTEVRRQLTVKLPQNSGVGLKQQYINRIWQTYRN